MSGMSEERQMLADTVAALVAKHASPAAVRAAIESERGYDEALWQLLCEQVGAAALVVPEDLGGAGGELAGHHTSRTGSTVRSRAGRRDVDGARRGYLDRRIGP
jgi:alkylation response protein AidB-like acyl-CoA dehydrogenase